MTDVHGISAGGATLPPPSPPSADNVTGVALSGTHIQTQTGNAIGHTVGVLDVARLAPEYVVGGISLQGGEPFGTAEPNFAIEVQEAGIYLCSWHFLMFVNGLAAERIIEVIEMQMQPSSGATVTRLLRDISTTTRHLFETFTASFWLPAKGRVAFDLSAQLDVAAEWLLGVETTRLSVARIA